VTVGGDVIDSSAAALCRGPLHEGRSGFIRRRQYQLMFVHEALDPIVLRTGTSAPCRAFKLDA
jgi:hypothetical protein